MLVNRVRAPLDELRSTFSKPSLYPPPLSRREKGGSGRRDGGGIKQAVSPPSDLKRKTSFRFISIDLQLFLGQSLGIGLKAQTALTRRVALAMARLRPAWSFAMVGPVVKVDPNLLPHSPNLFWLGGRDYQVTLGDLKGWQDVLQGRSNVEIRVFPDLNHLFVTGDGKSTPAEYNLPGHVAAPVITGILEWMQGGVGKLSGGH